MEKQAVIAAAANNTLSLYRGEKPELFVQVLESCIQANVQDLLGHLHESDRPGMAFSGEVLVGGNWRNGVALTLQDRLVLAWTSGVPRIKTDSLVVPHDSISAVEVEHCTGLTTKPKDTFAILAENLVSFRTWSMPEPLGANMVAAFLSGAAKVPDETETMAGQTVQRPTTAPPVQRVSLETATSHGRTSASTAPVSLAKVPRPPLPAHAGAASPCDAADSPASGQGRGNARSSRKLGLRLVACGVLFAVAVAVLVVLVSANRADQRDSVAKPAAASVTSAWAGEGISGVASDRDSALTPEEYQSESPPVSDAPTVQEIAQTPYQALELSEDEALEHLREARDNDRSEYEDLVGNWVPQVSSKCVGLNQIDMRGPDGFFPDGHAETKDPGNAQILAFHLAMQERYGVVTALWEDVSPRTPNYGFCDHPELMWHAFAKERFGSAAAANRWCDDQGFPVDECFARYLVAPGRLGTQFKLR